MHEIARERRLPLLIIQLDDAYENSSGKVPCIFKLSPTISIKVNEKFLRE
jgi:hypothetical protein